MPAKSWLAAYIYYSEPWDKLLVEAVHPFIKKIMNDALAEQYFFIRYWEKGPHIRLRFFGETETLFKKVKPLLNDFFSEYLKKSPSVDIKPGWVDELPEDQRWYPNNSVQFIEYEPEVERYGGPYAIVIAEKQFEASSKAVLAIISESADWSYERAMGSAIQLHLAFAFAVSMTLEEVKYFYDLIYRSWFHRAYYNYEKNVSEEELKKRSEITLKAFEENFVRQKDFLVATHKTLWNAFKENIEFEQDWLNEWIADVRNIDEELTRLQEQGKFIVPQYYNTPIPSSIRKTMYDKMVVYESYIHMTNNRIGILNRDEAFLGFLIKRSVEEL